MSSVAIVAGLDWLHHSSCVLMTNRVHSPNTICLLFTISTLSSSIPNCSYLILFSELRTFEYITILFCVSLPRIGKYFLDFETGKVFDELCFHSRPFAKFHFSTLSPYPGWLQVLSKLMIHSVRFITLLDCFFWLLNIDVLL